MAENNSYPMLSASNWWNIRKKFKQTIPGTVTSSYLSSVLNMQERSATNNIMPYLRQLGIIDSEGKTGERANLWRDDIDYPQVCDDIKKELYPQELLDIPYGTDEDKESIKRWFARTTGTGESTVGKISAFYFLLCEKDPSKEPANGSAKPSGQNGKAPKAKKPTQRSQKSAAAEFQKAPTVANQAAQSNAPQSLAPQTANIPAININLQIHISSDASPEQIDKIFESMNKHIYSRRDGLDG